MKRIVLFCVILFGTVHVCQAQEWFTSFDIAKRLAIVQNKMLFVIWEDALHDAYPVLINTEKGTLMLVDLSTNDNLDSLIWDHFIPVLLPESEYGEFLNQAKERGNRYIDKLNDNGIKIMDVNGNILNLETPLDTEQNLTTLINKYALNTSFLKQDLDNYSKNVNFTTTFNLASKYYDYAMFASLDIRSEVIELANLYFDEAKTLLGGSDLNNREDIAQRLSLFEIKEHLILDKPRKALRLLKKIEEAEIAEINKPFFSFLKYTTFKLLQDEDNAALWISKVSQVDLKKAQFIINNHKF
ncbi:hypothetical protein ACS386_10405 [Flavobacteriaceae bacterium LMO-SS05]